MSTSTTWGTSTSTTGITRGRTRAGGSPAGRLRRAGLALAAVGLVPAAQAVALPVVPTGAEATATVAAADSPVWTIDEEALRPGGVLQPGYSYTARHGSRLVMQTDGNLVLYRGGVPLWSSRTDGSPGAFAAFQTDGNLVVYRPGTAGPVALWSSGTAGVPGAAGALLVLEDRELSITYGLGTDGPSASVWGSGWASDRLVPGDELDAGDRRTSPDGRCVLVVQADRNLVEYCEGRAVWSRVTGRLR